MLKEKVREILEGVKKLVEKIQDKETKALAESIATKIEEANREEKIQDSFKLTDLRESGVNEVAIDFISLQEAKFNTDFSEVEVVLIEAGVNEQKKRCYPDKTIREAAPIFAGMKMYINHPTAQEEKERPERNLKDWASTIVESHYDAGKAMGKVSIHDPWLRERLADPVARQHIGLSILAGGKISMGKVNGKEGYQIIEAIIPARKNGPASVDWVTEAGARGRVSKLLESQRKERSMEYTDITIKELKEARPDLVAALGKEHAQSKEQADAQAKLAQELKEANAKIAAFDAKEKLSNQVELVESKLKDAKIPDLVKDRVRSAFKTAVVENIEEAVTSKIKEELDFVNKLTGNGKIKLGGEEQQSSVMESLQESLDSRAGIVKEEKK